LLCRRLLQVTHLGANAYLLALAAWQRGLKVTFHYEMASHCERFAHLPLAGVRGELMTISDGEVHHAFYRVLGDRTSLTASRQAESKPHTKAVLEKAGLDVPEGVVITPDRHAEAQAFLARHPGARFLLKPVNGTLGRGVLRNLDAEQVASHLQSTHEPLLLEEYVVGTEYRVYVTAGRVVMALIRRPASVLGDGRCTIAELVEHKAAERRAHSVYREDPLELDDAAMVFLADGGRHPDQVPPVGERVFLSDVASLHAGGDMIDGMQSLPVWAAELAVRAAQVLELPFAGLDMIVTPEAPQAAAAESPARRAVILEANQNPYIRLTAVPAPGILETTSNAVAESIIDHYFPASIGNARHPHASFDFQAICQLLQSGNVSSVVLPVLEPSWRHKRFILPAKRVNQRVLGGLEHARLALGIHAYWCSTKAGDVLVDVIAPEECFDAFRKITGV